MSCTSLVAPVGMKSTRPARVILPGGEIRQFREQVKAAELMMDCPNSFLVNSKCLNIGKRFSALSADEDLEFGNVYIVFSMKRVNSIVTAADMAMVLMAANSAARRISSGSGGGRTKVKPEMVVEEVGSSDEVVVAGGGEQPRLNSDEIEGFQVPEYRYRLAACRSRKPLLDTITEEPVFSR